MITFNEKTVLNATTKETKIIHRQNEIQRLMNKLIPEIHKAMTTLEGKKVCSIDGQGYQNFYKALRSIETQRGIRIFPEFYTSVIGIKIDFCFYVTSESVNYFQKHFYIAHMDGQTLTKVKDLDTVLAEYQEKYSVSEFKKASEKLEKLKDQISQVNQILYKYK